MNADERLAAALMSLVDQNRRLDMDLPSLLRNVKRHVKEAQKDEFLKARAHGKDTKLGDSITWMGTGERARDSFTIAIRSVELKNLLYLKGVEIQVEESDDQPILVRISPIDPTPAT